MILDHFTIHTADLERARRFYSEILGLENGYRPPFQGPPGAWLYNPEGRPVVHLYSGRDGSAELNMAVDHIAFRASGLEDTLKRLKENGVEYDMATVPELGATQVFFRDPDGIQIELNFESPASND